MERKHSRHLGAFLITAYILLNLQSVYVEALVSKIDCHPTDGASKEKCESLGCTWAPVYFQNPKKALGQSITFLEDNQFMVQAGFTPKSDISEPWCYFPTDYTGYKIVSEQNNRLILSRERSSALPNDIQELLVVITDMGPIIRVRITDNKNTRYEPEIPVLNLDYFKGHQGESKFDYQINEHSHLIIRRRETGAVLFRTDLTKLIFSDKFIQLNSELNSPFVYGLGEHFDSFLKMANRYRVYSFYNTDKLPLPEGRRSYGIFPFYINLDSQDQNRAHGVYLRNSDAMDIILQPDRSITFRPIGGILDFIIFHGPTPLDVITQYQNLVGLPDLPPRWSLGFHLCRYGYGSLERTKFIWNRTIATGIPFEVQWNDIDNMERHNDFTYDQDKFRGLPEFIDELHDSDMHYMMLFDPGLSQEDNYEPYSLGVEMDIFVKNATNQTLVGKVWNDSGRTVFPDFSNPKSIEYWTRLFVKFHQTIKFDGAWIDMNDISSFVYGSLDGCPFDNDLERPPYRPGGYDLQSNSLCLSARHRAGREYDLHNLYSFYEAISTFHALKKTRPGKRPFIISRSTSPGQGHYGGHWSGDVLSSWDYLRWSIPSLIEHSIYGFSMMGSDICGFTGNSNPELCARWSTLGAFYTFSRNHNDDVSTDQDPAAMGHDVIEANRNALTKKYSLLPYLYTLIHRAHRFGEPVIRSVPLEFYTTDRDALQVEFQFMWGGGLMISPVVNQGSYEVTTFLPKGRWYQTDILPTPEGTVKIPNWIDSEGGWFVTKNISLDNIAIFYRGGHIIPVYKKVQRTIAKTVKQPIGLEVALCQKNMARGEIYIDDGDNVDGNYNHLTMYFENNKLFIDQDNDTYQPSIGFGEVKIFGISSRVHEVKSNGQSISFDRHNHVLSFDLADSQVFNHKSLVVELL